MNTATKDKHGARDGGEEEEKERKEGERGMIKHGGFYFSLVKSSDREGPKWRLLGGGGIRPPQRV